MHRFLRPWRAAPAGAAALAVILAINTGTFGTAAQARGSSIQSVSSAAAGLASGRIVVDWNKELVQIIGTPGAQPATIHPTRSFAILHAAIYNAVASIAHSGSLYVFSVNAPAGARADAAAAEAGRDTLAALYPSWTAALDTQLAGELASIPNGVHKQQGIAVGRLAAALALGLRANDGSGVPPPPFPVSTRPGDYRVAPPAVPSAAFTQWAGVTPFVLAAANQFRSAPPPSLTSSAYAQAINEVKSLGAVNSTTRTDDQTVAAKFWSGPIWITWNQIAESSALAHHTNLVRTARLFALLNLSIADTTIALYDAKYFYHLWRPVTAIREAAGAGNPAVVADPTWTPLLTGSDPSYPGAHSAISAAAATVLTSFFGTHDRITVTSGVVSGVVRTFGSYNAAATEAGVSRIYAGVHTRFDHVAGFELGHRVAGFVLGRARTAVFGLR